MFIDRYTQEVLEDLCCMSSMELKDALTKINRYIPTYEGTKRGECLKAACERISERIPTADRNAKPYFAVNPRHDDRWGSETSLNV